MILARPNTYSLAYNEINDYRPCQMSRRPVTMNSSMKILMPFGDLYKRRIKIRGRIEAYWMVQIGHTINSRIQVLVRPIQPCMLLPGPTRSQGKCKSMHVKENASPYMIIPCIVTKPRKEPAHATWVRDHHAWNQRRPGPGWHVSPPLAERFFCHRHQLAPTRLPSK